MFESSERREGNVEYRGVEEDEDEVRKKMRVRLR